MLLGVLGSAQSSKIFITANLVAMTNSMQADDTLNGWRTALPIYITDSVGYMLTKKSSNHAFDMVPSSPTRQHKWLPSAQGYGRWSGATGAITPIMTTTCVLRAPRRDRKPGRVLRALQTAQGTTRSPGYVWWPVDGLIPHAAHGAHIPNLLSTGPPATRMWRDGAATP
jgi:hypothetical protein